MTTSLASQFGTQAQQQLTQNELSSTPIAIFQHAPEQILVCLADGTVGKITTAPARKVEVLKVGFKLIAADYNGAFLALGTVAGLLVFDFASNRLFRVSNYQKAVARVQFDADAKSLFATVLDLQNDQIQYQADHILFSLIQVCTQTWTVLRQQPKQLCNGLFDIAQTLQCPQADGTVRVFETASLKPLKPLQLERAHGQLSQFVANELLLYESGYCYFIKAKQWVNFEQRVNFVRTLVQKDKLKSVFLFGLQSGQIRFVNEDLSWGTVWQGQDKEVTCWSGETPNGKFNIGLGSFQHQERPGVLVETVLREVNGQFVI